jgi:mono/diheme cytochrome c family protein
LIQINVTLLRWRYAISITKQQECAIRILWVAALGLAGRVELAEPDGAKSFMNNCASCHSADAKGGGAMSRHLIKTAPDLTTLSARNGGIFPINYVMSTIDGFNRALHFSGAMPEFGANGMGDTIVWYSAPA